MGRDNGLSASRRQGYLKTALLSFGVLIAALGPAVGVAHAAEGRERSLFGAVAQPAFTTPSAIAIDQASGDLLVADFTTRTVSRYHEDGTPAPFTALGTNQISGFGWSSRLSIWMANDNSSGPAAGDVYVSDGNAIRIFSKSGAELGQLTEAGGQPFAGIAGLAVGPDGTVYVSDNPNNAVKKFVPSANPAVNANYAGSLSIETPEVLAIGAGASAGYLFVNSRIGGGTRANKYTTAGTFEYSVTNNNNVPELAVDPASGNVLVGSLDNGPLLCEYDASGATEASLVGSCIPFEEGRIIYGVAVRETTHDIYVSRGGSEHIEVFSAATEVPSVETGAATEVTNTTAKIGGSVNPAGNSTTYQFEYWTGDFSERTPVPPGAVGNDHADHAEEAQLTSLQPNTEYHYRITALYESGGTTKTIEGEERTFTTSGPATAETTGSPIRTAGSIQFEGRLDPEGHPTAYHFEYGTLGPCELFACTSTASVDAGSGDEIELVSQSVSGLAPATTYHYRLVADNGNSAGAGLGADLTVTTRANEDPLTHGVFPGPPGSDRAWEQVNGPDTNGNPVTLEFSSAFANDGNRAVYGVAGGTEISNSGSIGSAYVSERTASGWQARAISPPRAEAPGSTWFAPAGKSDLSDFVIVNGDVSGGGSTSLWRQPVGSEPVKLAGFEPHQRKFSIVSDDASRTLAAATGSLDPSHPVAPGVFNLYDVSRSAPRLIDLLPAETVPACGIFVEPERYGMDIGQGGPPPGLHWLSSDGSQAVFASRGSHCSDPPQLYVRDIPGEVTKRVSPPSLSGEECPAAFIKSSSDAVFFWTQGRLVSGDTAGSCLSGSLGGDIYRYGLDSETVTCITCLVSGVDTDVITPSNSNLPASAAIAVADNGSRVYFETDAKLVPGAASPGFYRVDVGTGDLRYIAPAEGSAVGDDPARGKALSRDGSVLIFRSAAPALNPIGGSDNGGTVQYYRYDDHDRSLTCVSCPQDGTSPTVDAPNPEASGLDATVYPVGPNNTPLDEAGDFVFSTPTALLPADQNTPPAGQDPSLGTDIYEWRDGRLLLVTDGATNWVGRQPLVGGITPSGRDIFFTAPKQYTADAVDAYPKLYDARIGGGFSFPEPPPPCPLEVCQGEPEGPPELGQAGSANFIGPSNPRAAFPHGKRHHRRARHRRGQHRKNQHRKNQNRRAGK